MTRVKICGITRLEDAEVAIEAGAHALGFVMENVSPRSVRKNKEALRIPQIVGPYASSVAVYSTLPRLWRMPAFGITGVQAARGKIPMGNGSIWFIRTIGVSPGVDLDTLLSGAKEGDAILLDASVPGLGGGTGQTIDWHLAGALCRLSDKHVILAGGLTPNNVAEAIRIVQPYGVDVSSGVESSPGIKDPYKVRDFLAAVKGSR